MAVNMCLQAPKELRSQGGNKPQPQEQPPLLKTHHRVLGGTGQEGEREPAFTRGPESFPTEHARQQLQCGSTGEQKSVCFASIIIA